MDLFDKYTILFHGCIVNHLIQFLDDSEYFYAYIYWPFISLG